MITDHHIHFSNFYLKNNFEVYKCIKKFYTHLYICCYRVVADLKYDKVIGEKQFICFFLTVSISRLLINTEKRIGLRTAP